MPSFCDTPFYSPDLGSCAEAQQVALRAPIGPSAPPVALRNAAEAEDPWPPSAGAGSGAGDGPEGPGHVFFDQVGTDRGGRAAGGELGQAVGFVDFEDPRVAAPDRHVVDVAAAEEFAVLGGGRPAAADDAFGE